MIIFYFKFKLRIIERVKNYINVHEEQSAEINLRQPSTIDYK